jgi:hypothetical protein
VLTCKKEGGGEPRHELRLQRRPVRVHQRKKGTSSFLPLEGEN